MNTSLARAFARQTLLTATLGVVACGGGGLGTDLDPDRRVASLRAYEAVELCLASAEYTLEHFDDEGWGALVCAAGAADRLRFCDAEPAQCAVECEQTAFNCPGHRQSPAESRSPSRCRGLEERDFEECPATVGEFEACTVALNDSFATLAARMTCDRDADTLLFEPLSPGCRAIIENDECWVVMIGQ